MKHARKDYDRMQDKKIPVDEPVFLIRGQDIAGADTVRYWARRNLEVGGSMELSAMAEAHALKMERWPRKKVADL